MKKIAIFIFLCIFISLPSYSYAYKQNNLFNGITIVLDAGHGGMDKGASVNETEEASLNLIITKKLENKLKQLGATVVLTRKDNEDLSYDSTFNKREDMKERVRIINGEKNDIFISIHMNKFSDSQVKGLHVFYNKQSLQSLELASMIQKECNEEMKQEKQIKKGDFYILNKSRIPGVIIECGFISNDENRINLLDKKYQGKLVDSIIGGLLLYFEGKGIG